MAQLKTLVETQGRKCYYCPVMTRLPMEKGSIFDMATREHKIPRAQGGTNDPSNIVVACYTCNCLKGSMTEEEFRNSPLLKDRIDEIENKRNRIGSIRERKLRIGFKSMRAQRKQEFMAKIIGARKGIPPEELLAQWSKREELKKSVQNA